MELKKNYSLNYILLLTILNKLTTQDIENIEKIPLNHSTVSVLKIHHEICSKTWDIFDKLYKIRDITFENVIFSNDGATAFSKYLLNNINTKVLKFQSTDFQKDSAILLKNPINGSKSVEVFTLEEITSQELSIIVQGLATQNSIYFLTLKNVLIDKNVSQSMTLMLENNKKISTLYLDNLKIESDYFLNGLKNNQSINFLNFQNMNIQSFTYIESSKFLERLRFYSCNISNEGWGSFGERFQNLNIKTLYLSSISFDEEGIYKLSKGLRMHNTLEKLDFSYITQKKGMKFLFESIKDKKSLKEIIFTLVPITLEMEPLQHLNCINLESINLSNCQIEDEGVKYLLKGIKNNHLKDLSLARNMIKEDGIEAISKYIMENGGPRHLNLCENHENHVLENVDLLFKSLKNSRVKSILYEKNKIQEEGAQKIGEYLKENDTLKILSFFDCQLTKKGFIYLFDILQVNDTISNITFGDNGVEIDLSYVEEVLTYNLSIKSLYMSLNSDNIQNILSRNRNFIKISYKFKGFDDFYFQFH